MTPAAAQTTIRPQASSNVTSFSNPQYAYDGSDGTFAGAAIGRVCHTDCTNPIEANATFDTFPAGYTASQLEVAWTAIAGFGVSAGSSGTVTAKLEYDEGSGWQTLETYTWTATSQACAGPSDHSIVCESHVAQVPLSRSDATESIRVRVTLGVQLQCNTCGIFGFSNITGVAKVFDIRATAICATPTNFTKLTGQDYGGGVLWFVYAWDSSSGDVDDLKCQVGEKVDYNPADLPFPSPPFPAGNNPSNPFTKNVDGFAEGFQDFHGVDGTWAPPYIARSVTASQIYRYSCPCYSGGTWITLLGPHDITKSVIDNGDGTWRYEVSKTGVTATINPLP
jgi:hypothetical protein